MLPSEEIKAASEKNKGCYKNPMLYQDEKCYQVGC